MRQDKIISGVYGGIAKYFDIDPKIVRLFWVSLVAACGSGLLVYSYLRYLFRKNQKIDGWRNFGKMMHIARKRNR